MGLAGVAGVVVGMPSFGLGLPEDELSGVLYLVASSLIWAVYVNVVKHKLAEINSLPAFTFTCICTTAFLLPVMLLRGEPSRLFNSGPGSWPWW